MYSLKLLLVCSLIALILFCTSYINTINGKCGPYCNNSNYPILINTNCTTIESTFDKNCLSDNKSLLISGCILLIIPTFALCLECLFITFFKRDVIKRYV